MHRKVLACQVVNDVVARRVVEFRLALPPGMTETRNALLELRLANVSELGLTSSRVGLWIVPMSERPPRSAKCIGTLDYSIS